MLAINSSDDDVDDCFFATFVAVRCVRYINSLDGLELLLRECCCHLIESFSFVTKAVVADFAG